MQMGSKGRAWALSGRAGLCLIICPRVWAAPTTPLGPGRALTLGQTSHPAFPHAPPADLCHP